MVGFVAGEGVGEKELVFVVSGGSGAFYRVVVSGAVNVRDRMKSDEVWEEIGFSFIYDK